MNIRLMTINDYDAVYSVWTGTAGMGMRSLDDSRDGIMRFLRRNPTTCFVAETGGVIAGVILCGHDGRRGYIYHTAVKPECRKQGIGRQLVDNVLAALKSEGINKVALVAFKTNEAGNAFWQSIGFTARDDLIYRNLSLNEHVYELF
ncbi:Acetyltransferase YpeA [bioreactor metagenome]|uniref:Acetyltransferase YpeA n=1 Tax=bioreactor metagenome TaxID=1076179 RepID=A0A645B656_9ZZZZ|nr:GNAT family N-acetyltransferase [Oscillospiraceae bacterium]